MVTCIIIMFVLIIFCVLCFIGAMNIRNNSSTPYDPEPFEFGNKHIESPLLDLDDFRESYLHRNDEKHDRHKRNQTPW